LLLALVVQQGNYIAALPLPNCIQCNFIVALPLPTSKQPTMVGVAFSISEAVYLLREYREKKSGTNVYGFGGMFIYTTKCGAWY
jgi:hypothetical protein